MANYQLLIPFVLKWEGGYAGNIDGAICTMKGVTLATFQRYYGKDLTCGDLRRISDMQWSYIFKNGYWDKWKADTIDNQSIANLLVDWLWMSGKYGITIPLLVLGVVADGQVGPKTIAAINNYPDLKELFIKLWKRRESFFKNIAKGQRAKFLKGWLRRLNDLKWRD